jgi:hypothetical protein
VLRAFQGASVVDAGCRVAAGARLTGGGIKPSVEHDKASSSVLALQVFRQPGN